MEMKMYKLLMNNRQMYLPWECVYSKLPSACTRLVGIKGNTATHRINCSSIFITKIIPNSGQPRKLPKDSPFTKVTLIINSVSSWI